MEEVDLLSRRAAHRRSLFEDVLPFWLGHSLDHEHGGYLHCLGRGGQVWDSDKGLWIQGRFAWLLATLAEEFGERPEAGAWARAAESGLRFLDAHGFADDGRMWFQVTREGRPLRRRRYLYTESFAGIAFGAWARYEGDEVCGERALGLLDLFRRWMRDPASIAGCDVPKVEADSRSSLSLGPPMIQLAMAQVLRDCLDASEAQEAADEAVDRILGLFLQHDEEALLETVGPRGELLSHAEGRTLNPGHAMEAAWFLLEEARHAAPQRAEELRLAGLKITDWTWKRGWDSKHGGLFAFTSVDGGPVAEVTATMKYWWPQTEAALALLHAYEASGDQDYLQRYAQVMDWATERFGDPGQGEWFGYLQRDGAPTTSIKGNLWKGPFHLPRLHLVAGRVIDRMQASGMLA